MTAYVDPGPPHADGAYIGPATTGDLDRLAKVVMAAKVRDEARGYRAAYFVALWGPARDDGYATRLDFADALDRLADDLDPGYQMPVLTAPESSAWQPQEV